MTTLVLRRIDDARRVLVESSCEPPDALEGKTAYDAGYRRIVNERELPAGRARVFETGGEFVLIIRESNRVCAFDAQPMVPAERTPHLVHAQQFTVEPAVSPAAEAHRLDPLPVAMEDGWIWVGVEER
ncbi:MAG: hypothetical protein ACRD1T_12975 [Acidimicrobiia bacterium]